jgi:hypothetical protein
LKNVGEAASARQKQAKKRSLRAVNEHFEPVFNAAMATQVVFQQPAGGMIDEIFLMNEFFGSVWWLIVTLGLLVTFHEFGHFIVARWFGVKVLRFSVGFGKPLWMRRDRHGTEFAVAAIPLGGYVKMLDEREGEVAPADLDQAHNRKPVLQRMAIAAAGPRVQPRIHRAGVLADVRGRQARLPADCCRTLRNCRRGRHAGWRSHHRSQWRCGGFLEQGPAETGRKRDRTHGCPG